MHDLIQSSDVEQPNSFCSWSLVLSLLLLNTLWAAWRTRPPSSWRSPSTICLSSGLFWTSSLNCPYMALTLYSLDCFASLCWLAGLLWSGLLLRSSCYDEAPAPGRGCWGQPRGPHSEGPCWWTWSWWCSSLWSDCGGVYLWMEKHVKSGLKNYRSILTKYFRNWKIINMKHDKTTINKALFIPIQLSNQF